MKGLDIARRYFEEYGRPMLQEQFPELIPYLACGLAGSGSECFGYDDEVSRDHDFEPGFCIFLPGEDVIDRRSAFLLERSYAALPKEFMGLKRSLMDPVGGTRKGVLRTADFFREKTGMDVSAVMAGAGADRGAGSGQEAPLYLNGRQITEHEEINGAINVGMSPLQWLSIPEHSLAEAVNGEIFFDNLGEVTALRTAFARYPEDVRRKKLAGNLLLMAQSGQYNYLRCIRHHEGAAAQLAVGEFARSTMNVIFLLNRRYQPYYKWSFRALRALPVLSLEAELLEYLLTTDNDGDMFEEKYRVIEGINSDVIDVLMDEGITKASCGDLEKHAYSVNDSIADGQLRNMHILAAV